MIPLDDILDIICTEAFEHSGIPEVPDHRFGLPPNYAFLKRDARAQRNIYRRANSQQLPTLEYDLELVIGEDGKLHWVE